MIEFIKTLKLPVYLGTNQESYRTNHIKNLVGQYFNGCFASHEIGHIKPSPEFFKYIENFLHLKPEELLLVDDTLANIKAAKALGWHVYHYQNDLEKLKRFTMFKNKL